MNRFSSRCASWSRCRLSPRTDMTDNKPHAGDDNSPRSNHFCQNSWIFGRHCPAAVERLARLVRFRPMKPFLHLLREFGEIHLRDSSFSSKHNPSPSTRLTVASLYTLPLVVLKSSESPSDANRTAKITTVVRQYFTRRDSAVFRLHTATTK
jgi:hypothetical protein